MKSMIRNTAVALSLLFAAQAASAAIIDFDTPPQAAGVIYHAYTNGQSFDYNGFTFTNGDGYQYIWGPNDPSGVFDNSPNSNGSNNWIFAGDTGTDITTITRTGGGLFDFTGLVMAMSWDAIGGSDSVFFNGVEQIISNTLTNYEFSFFGISSLTITSLQNLDIYGNPPGYWTADDLNLTAVPLPAGVVLLLTALGGLGMASKRRKSS